MPALAARRSIPLPAPSTRWPLGVGMLVLTLVAAPAQAATGPLVLRSDAARSSAASDALVVIEQRLEEAGEHIDHGENRAAVGVLDVREEVGKLTVRLAAPHRGITWSRTVDPASNGSRAIEELALFARWAVEALRDLEQAPPASPVPTASPPRPEPRRARLDIGYLATARTEQAGWEGGAAVSASLRVGRRFEVRATYDFLPTLDLQAVRATGQIARHPLRVSFGPVVTRGRLDLAPELSAAIDVQTQTTDRTAAGLDPVPRSHRVEVGVGAGVTARAFVGAGIAAFVALGADVMPLRAEVVDAASQPTPLHTGRPFQPRFVVGLGFAP